MFASTFLLGARRKSMWCATIPVALAIAFSLFTSTRAVALEHLILEVSGSFEEVPGAVLQPATAIFAGRYSARRLSSADPTGTIRTTISAPSSIR